jgi:ABC-type Zn uptake system ZnuABC Zn-binding protein ZnuA
VLLTDHATLGYFARHYGFQEAGTILPGVTTVAEPSARDLADRARFIRAEGVPAVFVGMGSNAELTDRIASDAGIAMVRLYTESLSSPRGPAPDYVAFMRYNVLAIVAGLTGSVDRGDG